MSYRVGQTILCGLEATTEHNIAAHSLAQPEEYKFRTDDMPFVLIMQTHNKGTYNLSCKVLHGMMRQRVLDNTYLYMQPTFAKRRRRISDIHMTGECFANSVFSETLPLSRYLSWAWTRYTRLIRYDITDIQVRLFQLWVTLKVKGKGRGTCYRAAYMSQTRDQQRFYTLGSGNWLARATDSAAHHAAIHCPR